VKQAPAARIPRAREVAAAVIARVESDEAFAPAVLEAELARAVQLDARDRALATELVYGCLRVLPWLLEQLGRHAPRGLDAIDARVRAHLTVAAYQLFFTRVPAFAAVSEAVESVRSMRGPRVAGFANAVLRRTGEQATSDLRGPDRDLREEAIVASAPAWLREALERALSPEGARAFLRCGTEPPAVGLRVEHKGKRDEWLARLRAAAPAAQFEPGAVSPHAILSRGAGKPQRLPGFREGAWSVQEEGSQVAALALGVREGDVVLDACAGRGNKTAILARAVGASGAVDACDAAPSKLARLREELARLGLSTRATYPVDWSVGPGEVEGVYDRVLVDAPCTGVGTLRRRPEIALRRQPADLERIARMQVAIAARAAERVRPGGTLLYVVCSVLREEAEDVVAALLRARPELTPAPFEPPTGAVLSVAGGSGSGNGSGSGSGSAILRLLPYVHGTDGYFVASLRRR
jgi:16S rRNA (cytosine967-C5)-methyltransferase